MIRFVRTARRARHAAAAATFLTLALLGSSALAADQADGKAKAPDKPSATAAQDPMMEAMMKYAMPGPEHAALNPLVGTWKSVTKMSMAPGDTTVIEGTIERTWIMGGRYVMAKHTGNYAGMPFEGMEILGYDVRHKKYVSTWIDNMGTGISMSDDGTWDPAAKTLTIRMPFDDPVTGKPAPFRMITKIVDENSQVYTMVGTVNGKDVQQMEATYTRVK